MKSFRNLLILFLVFAAFVYARYLYQKPKLVNGDIAIEIKSVNPKGDSIQLTSLKGHYILLEFWASWCGPCRKQNPGIRTLYDEYKDRTYVDADGFVVFAYGLEDNTSSWIKAIQQDQLDWHWHAMGTKRFEDEFAKAYGIRSIPANFLIDPDFTIIGVNLDDRAIAKILDKRLQTN